MKPMEIAMPIVVIALFLAFIFLSITPQDRLPDDMEALARCLAANGARMYGSELCTHCQEQKDSFGDSWQYVTYVECHSPLGGQTEACKDAGIKAYPTWEFQDKSRNVGTMTFRDLSQASGCPLENRANETS